MAKTPEEQLGVSLPDPEPVEIQPDPTTELEAEQPEAEQRPEWLPENYKTPEDFAKAHGEIRNAYNREVQQRQQLEQQLGEMQAWAQQQQTPQQDDVREQLEAAFESNPLDTIQWMAEQAAVRAAQQTAQAQQQQYAPQFEAQNEILAANADMLMERRYDDWDDVKPRIAEAIQSDPLLLPDASMTSMGELQKRLDVVYRLVKSEDLMREQQDLREQGLQQADVSRARKLSAGTLPGASGRAEQLSPADQQLAEMKQARAGSSWNHIRENTGR